MVLRDLGKSQVHTAFIGGVHSESILVLHKHGALVDACLCFHVLVSFTGTSAVLTQPRTDPHPLTILHDNHS